MKQLNKSSRLLNRSICLLSLVLVSGSVFAGNSGGWSTPVPVDGVNSSYFDGCQFLTLDGKTMIVASERDNPGQSPRDMDLYVFTREDDDEPFGNAYRLPEGINSDTTDVCPALSHDGHFLYFASVRNVEGSCGDRDIYVAYRADTRRWDQWESVQNLGCDVNTAKVDQGPSFFRDADGRHFIYFSSNRPVAGVNRGHDIWYVQVGDDGMPVGPVQHEDVLSTEFNDHRPFISYDGRMVVFDTNRPGAVGGGGDDVWMATRAHKDDAFGEPVPVPNVNTPGQERRPVLSKDKEDLYISRVAGGDMNVVVATNDDDDDHDD